VLAKYYVTKYCVGPKVVLAKYCVSQNILLAKTLLRLKYFDNQGIELAKTLCCPNIASAKHYADQTLCWPNIVSVKYCQPKHFVSRCGHCVGQNITSVEHGSSKKTVLSKVLCHPNVCCQNVSQPNVN
jgi:hypothetical protein